MHPENKGGKSFQASEKILDAKIRYPIINITEKNINKIDTAIINKG